MQADFRFNAFGRLSRWVMLPVFLAAALGSAPLSSVHAIGSTITVDTLDGGLVDGAGSGDCSLAEAIHNANIDGGGTPYLDCALGAGDDDIVFSVGGTITLTQTLPTIDDPQNETTVIDGDGNITIDGNNTYEIFTVLGYAAFRDLIVRNADDPCCSGGAVYVGSGGHLTVQQSHFLNNFAIGNGGAILNDDTLTVERSTFTSNGAGEGGAIYNSGTATISNSTLYNNYASGSTLSQGGGAILSNSTTTVYSSTFSHNLTFVGDGAALSSTAGTTTVHNSILANSILGHDCDLDGGAVAGTYDLIEDDNCGFTDGVSGMILGDDPKLGAFVSSPSYFKLRNDSPALDAGDNSLAVGSVDEPGNARRYEIPWASNTGLGTSPVIDLGAYENQIDCPGGSPLYVDDSAGGESSGTSWTNAFTDLQMALNTVNNCSPADIWVAAGLYKPDRGVPESPYETFTVSPGTGLYGGFNGTESSLGARDPGANVTILSGDVDENDANAGGSEIDQTVADIAGFNTYRLVYMDGSGTPITSSTVLDGFTITGGDGVAGSSYGGGMLCYGQSGGTCSPTLSSLTFSGNRATYGGALMNQGPSGTSSPALTDVTFSGNYANGGGGAVYNWGTSSGGVSSPSFRNVTFYNNSAATAGAIWNDGNSGGDSSPAFTNVTFSNNFSAGSGGALYNGASSGTSSPTLTNVILWGNSAVGTGQQIQNETGAAPTINYSVVEGGNAGSNMGTAFSSGTGNTSGDPKLGALRDNGGSTQTMALWAGSSAIDAGDGGSCPAADQRGVSRPRGAACDIGAFERIPPVTDFEFDYKTDPAKFIPSTGTAWWLKSSTSLWDGKYLGGDVAEYVGRSDFDGDGKTDPAKYVSGPQALWYFGSSDLTMHGVYMGSGSYSMVPGSDYDGDGQTDPARFLTSAGAIWRLPSTTGVWVGTFVGMDAAPALPGSDYDGDGTADLAKYVPGAGAIWYFGSEDSAWHGMYIGSDGTPVPASDFDGDGITDMAKYLTSGNVLWYRSSTTGTWTGVYLGPGAFTYVPAADFDGDGRTDPAKFDTGSKALWYLKSTTDTWVGIYMGGETYSIVN